jgi:light-regulated signal transduction histidine kinase (bacteriophytochrome)
MTEASTLQDDTTRDLLAFIDALGEGRFGERVELESSEGHGAALAKRLNELAQRLAERDEHASRVDAELEAKLRELEHSKSDLESFARVASHDLQEPLRMVRSYVSLLVEHLAPHLDDTARVYAHYASEGATRMKELIDDLLQYSHLRTARSARVVALADACQVAIRALRLAIEESGARFELRELPSILADPTQVSQLFQNLFSNAIKYRDPARTPHIVVASELQGDNWVVSVTDNGIGVEPAFFEQIFELFTRLHGRDDYSGTGIGLALCKRIAAKLGGDIWLTSEVGVGSTFFVRLPRAHLDDPAPGKPGVP